MPAELSITKDGRAEMFYFGERPWHFLGTQVDHLATAAEALEAAHLDWAVDKRQVFYKNAEGLFVPSEHYVVARADTDEALGVVTDSYQPLQNKDAFSFVDALTATGEAKYETAGALFGGKKVWVLARIPGNVKVAEGDEIEKYILLANTHDGTAALRCYITPVRVVCNNTLRLAAKHAESDVRIIHTGNLEGKIDEARRILGLAVDAYATLEAQCQKLLKVVFSKAESYNYIDSVLEIKNPEDVSSRLRNIRESIAGIYDSPKIDTEAGTLWGAYNAVTDYADHYSSIAKKDADKRFSSLTFGSGALLKARAYSIATQIAAAA